MAKSSVVSILRCLILFVFVIFAGTASARADDKVNYSGHYELAGKKSDRSFSLDITQDHSRADVSFSAAMSDGSGAAPDGEGKGRIEDGVLSFKFKDSFANEGTCHITPVKAGEGTYRLVMTILKVINPEPMHFYGEMALHKVADQPASP